MAKSNRGKILKKRALKSGEPYRGTCPKCKKTGIKLLHSHVSPSKDVLKVCKNCRNK